MYGGEESDYEQEDEYMQDEHTMDDSLDVIERLEKYCTSEFAGTRQVLVRDIGETAKVAGVDGTKERILPLLPRFAKDSDPVVRDNLLKNLVELAKYFLGEDADSGYELLKGSFFPSLMGMVVDKNARVGLTALNAVVELADSLKDEDLDDRIIQHLQKLAQNERFEDDRMVAAELFNRFAPRLGKEKCEELFDEIAKLAGDQRLGVRRVAANNLSALMSTLGVEAAVEKVGPVFLKLCEDEQWEVRKACVEHMVQVSQVVTPEYRKGALREQYLKFLNDDSSKWVKVQAKQKLGEFLYTFEGEDIDADFLKLFTELANTNEHAEYCAFYLQAVIQTVGGARWSEFDEAFETLSVNPQWKVRRTMSFALSEIAKVVGPDLTNEKLSQSFLLFLSDVDEVQAGIFSHAAAYIECCAEADREKLVTPLCRQLKETENWRLRQLFAGQFGDIAALMSPEFCKSTVEPLMKKLATDHVSEVRIKAHASCAKLLKRLEEGSQHSALQDWSGELLGDEVEVEHYQSRQNFAQIAAYCAGEGVLTDYYMSKIDKLTSDPCANVRIALVKVLKDVVEWKTVDSGVAGVMTKLTEDSDSDVKRYAEEGKSD